MPETTLTPPPESVEVRVDCSSESVKLAETAKSKLAFGCAVNSSSTPWLRASGTLNTRREEQEPAVTVACRSLMSAMKIAPLKLPRPPITVDLRPTS